MTLPSQVNTVITTNENADIKIYWDVPFSGGLGVPIIGYEVLIMKSDSSFVSYPATCDGNSSTVLTNHYCLIPMSVITDTTFGFS